MKISKELHHIKRSLQLNFIIKEQYVAPDLYTLLEKWREMIKNINYIFQAKKCVMCYQDLYSKINALLIYDIPKETLSEIEACLESFADKTLNDLYQTVAKHNFLESFNSIWSNVVNSFVLIQNILNKFQRKAYCVTENDYLFNQCKI